MTADSLKSRLQDAVKSAMRAKEKDRLTSLRMLQAAIKQIEVDERIEIDDPRALGVLEKLVKRGRQSVAQFREAERADLVAKEEADLAVLEEFMPAQMGETELIPIIDGAIAETGASGPQDMGKVMKAVKEQVAGQADMGQVSALVKSRLIG